MKKNKLPTLKVKTIQGCQYQNKWYWLTTTETGEIYMCFLDLETNKQSDWIRQSNPKK